MRSLVSLGKRVRENGVSTAKRTLKSTNPRWWYVETSFRRESRLEPLFLFFFFLDCKGGYERSNVTGKRTRKPVFLSKRRSKATNVKTLIPTETQFRSSVLCPLFMEPLNGRHTQRRSLNRLEPTVTFKGEKSKNSVRKII